MGTCHDVDAGVMAPCWFGEVCWRPLCPYRQSGKGRAARWAAEVAGWRGPSLAVCASREGEKCFGFSHRLREACLPDFFKHVTILWRHGAPSPASLNLAKTKLPKRAATGQMVEQGRGKSRSEMQKPSNTVSASNCALRGSNMRRYKGTIDIFFGIEHRMRREDMEEEFNNKYRQTWMPCGKDHRREGR